MLVDKCINAPSKSFSRPYLRFGEVVALVPFKGDIVIKSLQHFILPADIIANRSHCLIAGFFLFLAEAEVYAFHGRGAVCNKFEPPRKPSRRGYSCNSSKPV